MSFETKLGEELDRRLDSLKDTEVTSDEYKVLMDSVTKLTDRAIELKKVDAEAENQRRIREHEEAMKRKQMKEDRIDKIIGHVLNGIRIGGTFAVCMGLAAMTFTYEEKGTVASPIGKHLLKLAIPKL